MKNLKRTALAVCLLAIVPFFGQTGPELRFETVATETPVEEVSYHYLLAHGVFLRAKPSLKAKRLAVLDIGTRMILRKESANVLEINGITSHWYRVTVGNATGWIWGGMIAQEAFGSGADYEVKFVYGLESHTTSAAGVHETTYQLRAFRDGVQLDKIVLDSLAAVPVTLRNIGNKGLFNVEDILTLDLADRQSGALIGKSYVFWNNGKFTNIANLRNYETDTYAKSEYFVFPSDMQGIKSILELKTTIAKKGIGAAHAMGKNLKAQTSGFYVWNGYELVKKEYTPVISKDAVASAANK